MNFLSEVPWKNSSQVVFKNIVPEETRGTLFVCIGLITFDENSFVEAQFVCILLITLDEIILLWNHRLFACVDYFAPRILFQVCFVAVIDPENRLQIYGCLCLNLCINVCAFRNQHHWHLVFFC